MDCTKDETLLFGVERVTRLPSTLRFKTCVSVSKTLTVNISTKKRSQKSFVWTVPLSLFWLQIQFHFYKWVYKGVRNKLKDSSLLRTTKGMTQNYYDLFKSSHCNTEQRIDTTKSIWYPIYREHYLDHWRTTMYQTVIPPVIRRELTLFIKNDLKERKKGLFPRIL